MILDVPDGESRRRRLLRRGVIVDYRPGAGIRMAPHFYNTEAEIDRAVSTLNAIVGIVRAGPWSQHDPGAVDRPGRGHDGAWHRACTAISAGYDTRLFDVDPASLEKGRASIQSIVAKGVELERSGRLTRT